MIKMPETKSIPAQSLPFHLGYLPALDGIRGFAVLWVMGFHFNLPLGRDGLFGVDIFFTLSGFLITVLLLEEWERSGGIRLGSFYLRRVLRLYPALLVVLITFVMVIPRTYLVSTLFYFTNWLKAFHLQPDSLYMDHTWSLSVEEQYYLLWPISLMLLLRTKLPKKFLILIPLAIGCASAVARVLVWNSTHDWFRVYMGTDLHADGLLIGSAFGMMTFYRLLPDLSRHKLILNLITIITLLLAGWLLIDHELSRGFIPLFGNLGVALGTLIIISRLVVYPSKIISQIFTFPPLVKIGVISYGLYLWHAPVGVVVDNSHLPWSMFFITLAKIGLTFLAATLSYIIVEKPILRLKDRLASAKPGIVKQPVDL